MKILITIRHKLFHNSHSEPVLATVTATTNRDASVIAIGQLKTTPDLADQKDYVRQSIDARIVNPILRERIAEFIKDTRYCIQWGEENCIETTMKDITV